VKNIISFGLIKSLRFVADVLRKCTDDGYGCCIQTWKLTIMTEQ